MDHAKSFLKNIVSGSINHFILAFPQYIWRFIYELFLSQMKFIMQNNKGRIIIDPSSHVHNNHDSRALNNYMDKHTPFDGPLTYYVTAQQRH